MKKKLSNVIIVSLVALMLAASLVGCNSSSTTTTAAATEAETTTAAATTQVLNVTESDAVTATGSLIPAWAEKGVSSSFILGYSIAGKAIDGVLKDSGTAVAGDDGVVTISNVEVYSNLEGKLEDNAATNTGAVYVNGGSEDTSVVVKDAKFNFSDDTKGTNANDFTGLGAVVVATGSESTDTTLVLDNVNIKTDGFGRDGVIADAYANVLMQNSEIITLGSNPLTEAYDGYASTAAQAYMISPPWILGIYGGVRASNVLGTNSSFTVIDSNMESGSWAVISTDDCTQPTVNVVNSTLLIREYDGSDATGNNSSISMNGGAKLFGYETNYGSGYGTYNIGSSIERFYGTTFEGVTYATILTGAGETYYGASYAGLELYNDQTGELITTYEGEAKDTVVNAVFGVMDHQGAPDVTLDEGSVWNTEEAVILVRGAQSSTFTVSGAELNPKSGIIFQMMDDDDGYGTSGAGGDTTGDQGFAKWTGEAWGMPTFSSGFSDPNEAGFVTPQSGGSYNTKLVLTKGASGEAADYVGDVLNGSGTGSGTTAGGLIVNIQDGASLTGAISSTSAVHGLPYSEDAVAYLDELAAKYGEGVAPNGGEACTVKYTLIDADGNVTTDKANAAYIQVNEFTMNEYYIISHVINKIMSGANVLVQVDKGATWNVTEDCYIKGLINEGTINIADGVTLYVNGTPYDGTSAEAGDITSGGGGGSVDTSEWVVGQNYRSECVGKYSDITIDGNAYYMVGSSEPVDGCGILNVAFDFQGWLKVNEDGSYTISKDYIEMAQQGGGDMGGGDMGGGDMGGDPGAGGGDMGGDPGAGGGDAAGGDPGAAAGGDAPAQP